MTTMLATRRMRPKLFRPTTAGDMMASKVLSLEAKTPIRKAAALLSHYELDSAPVVDSFGRPMGIVTTSACAAWEEFTLRSTPEKHRDLRLDWSAVSEILSPNIELVDLDSSDHAVIERMIERRARRVYVIDEAGKLVGVVSVSDALSHLIRERIHSPMMREPAL